MSEKKIDLGVLVDCAESFQRVGESLMPKIRERVPEGSSLKPAGLGDLVCCAANLGFSLELYLKALHSHMGNDAPRGHDLLELYSALPTKARESMERAFDELVNSASHEARAYASISVAKGAETSPAWPSYPAEPKDLESVLRRSKDVFVSWRYLFEVEIPEHETHQTHQFEYLLLDFACKVLRAHLKPKF